LGCLPFGYSGLGDYRGQKGGKKERTREGRMGGCWESKVNAGSAPNPSHSTKISGKMLLAKKAHEKSLTSKSKV
jgi:hypothetical protein